MMGTFGHELLTPVNCSAKDSQVMLFVLLILILDQKKKALEELHLWLDLWSEYGAIQHSLVKISLQHCQPIMEKCGCSGEVL